MPRPGHGGPGRLRRGGLHTVFLGSLPWHLLRMQVICFGDDGAPTHSTRIVRGQPMARIVRGQPMASGALARPVLPACGRLAGPLRGLDMLAAAAAGLSRFAAPWIGLGAVCPFGRSAASAAGQRAVGLLVTGMRGRPPARCVWGV